MATEAEKFKKFKEIAEKEAAVIKARKEAEIKAGFLNPFGKKTTYTEFMEQVGKSKKSVAEYCKEHLTDEQISWLENDLKHFKK